MQKKSINGLNLDVDPIPSEPMICYASWLILQKSLSIYAQNSSEHQDVGTEQEREQVTDTAGLTLGYCNEVHRSRWGGHDTIQ